ncbi:ATP-binding cassette domain-containing protein [Piscinibacter terrae]|uniref:ATP-binding cassette domain-containing protein n=1 Tax=Piscinibacter terrae TaxID=2496871 RepID=A0A3N7HJJ2_9BURK|nr:ATP-binding cassette domain-containing protein [Albitalea terrae]RQP22228.1 ATP-binding cassette domain-containing protein [Albitalea terrae]
MRLLRMIATHSPGALAWALALGLASGVSFAAVVALLDSALGNPAWLRSAGAIPAVLLFVAAVGTLSFLSGHVGARLVLSQVTRIRRFLVRDILAARLQHLEAIGQKHLTATLIDEVQRVSQGAWAMPVLLLNLGVCVAVYAYMGLVNGALLLIIVIAQAAIFSGISLLFRRFMPMTNQVAAQRRQLVAQLQFFTGHTKELKQSSARTQSFLDDLLGPQLEKVQRGTERLADLATSMDSLTKVGFLLVIGLLVGSTYAIPGIASDEQLRSVIVAFMFVITPFSSVLSTAQQMADADQALKSIQSFSTEKEPAPVPAGQPAMLAPPETIGLQCVSFTYRGPNNDTEFAMTAIDFELRRGEIVALQGGNGSGKTTLAKLLCGLYAPQSGCLTADGAPVVAAGLLTHRQHIGAVWSGNEQTQFWFPDQPASIDAALSVWDKFGLSELSAFEPGWVEYAALSTGQRGRVALAATLADPKPFLVFDEWTANQDKRFRQIFYAELLPRLRARGIGVLVISHDDEAREVADRVVQADRAGWTTLRTATRSRHAA